jgi:hypothetical protein
VGVVARLLDYRREGRSRRRLERLPRTPGCRIRISMELLTVVTPPDNSMQPTALRAAADAEC